MLTSLPARCTIVDYPRTSARFVRLPNGKLLPNQDLEPVVYSQLDEAGLVAHFWRWYAQQPVHALRQLGIVAEAR